MTEQERKQLQGMDYNSLALLVLRLRDAHCEQLDRILALEEKVAALTRPRSPVEACPDYDDSLGED